MEIEQKYDLTGEIVKSCLVNPSSFGLGFREIIKNTTALLFPAARVPQFSDCRNKKNMPDLRKVGGRRRCSRSQSSFL